jgi:hypothetical protein
VIESAGIPTVTLELIWVYQRLLGIPRVAAVEHPFGRPYGDVGDADTQRAVVEAALGMFETASVPGSVEHLPFVWPEEPKQTKWHPAEPSPIIALLKKRRS